MSEPTEREIDGARTAFVEGFSAKVIEFCQERFETPRDAADFLEHFFDLEPPWKKIIRGEKP